MLDTRLKSKYKICLNFVVGLIVAFALIFTLSYPSLEKLGRKYQSRPENLEQMEREQANKLSTILINSTLALTKQVREQKEGSPMTNVEVYMDMEVDEDSLKQYEEEYELFLEMIDEFIIRSNGWSHSYNKFRNHFSFEVISSKNDEVLIQAKGMDFTETDGLSKIILSYDGVGNMTVKDLELNGGISTEVSHELEKALDKYSKFDPLRGYDISLFKKEGDIKHKFELNFKPPKDLDFVYYFDSAKMFGMDSIVYTHRISYFYNFIYMAIIVVVLLGISLSFLKDYSDKSDRTNAPLEVILVIMILVLGTSGSGIVDGLIVATLNNNLSDFLFNFGVFKVLADTMIFMLNVFVWMVLLGVSLWGTLNLCAIIQLGPKKYFIENTVTGFLFRKISQVYHFIIQTDIQVNWNDSAFRQFGKLIGLNFLVLIVMNMLHFNNFFGLLIYSLFVLAIVANYYNRKKEHFKKILSWMDTLARGELFFEEKSAVEADPKKRVYVNENLGEFEPFDERLRLINDGFIKAVDKERESQSSKSELITNMSHDLKTPLTAIIMYINLLKDENISVEERKKYIDILDAKSMRFKSLIDDLFEMSLASTGKLRLEKADVDIVGLLKGLRLEYNEKIDEAGIDFRWQLPDNKCILSLDAKKTYRIFENLLINITKYALKGSRAYINFSETSAHIDVTLINISDIEITSSPEKLLERFSRADTSRNTPGSGLGLAIAKNLTEAQDGELSIDVEGDVFKINVRFYCR